MKKLKVLDLFSGIGGFALGLDSTGFFETVKFVEKDKYCQKVLRKNFPNIPIEEDIKNVKGKEGEADVVCGGFPCQPFSVAGKQKGTSDDRHLWPEMFRLIREIKPQFVIGENVKNIVNIQDGVVFETVCTDLESEGYEVQSFNIPAAGVGAPHRRERIWIVANTHSNGEKRDQSKDRTGSRTQQSRKDVAHSKSIESDVGKGRQHQEERERQLQIRGKNSDDANTNGERLQRHRSEYELRNSSEEEQTSGNSWWSVEPDVGRVAHGVPGRVHRLKALGNSIVPQIAREIGLAIKKVMNEDTNI